MKRFDRTTSVGRSVRRIAADGLGEALLAATDGSRPPDQIVHELRRTAKSLRALVRLVRDGFPDYRRENLFLRETGRVLAASRDAEAVRATYDGLVRRRVIAPDAELRALVCDDMSDAVYPAQAIGQAIGRLGALRRRVVCWRFETSGFDLIAPGLREVYARMRRAERLARNEPEPARYHQWRKFVKQHAVHLSLLRESAPDILDAYGVVARSLGEVLGELHDLDLLETRLAAGWNRPRRERRDLFRAIADRRTGLERRAFRLGRELAAERPAAFVDRTHRMWRAWRK